MAGTKEERYGFFLDVGNLHTEDDPRGLVTVTLYQDVDNLPECTDSSDGMLLSNALVSALSEVVAAFRTDPELITTAYLEERKRKRNAELTEGVLYIAALKKSKQGRKKVPSGK